MKQSKSVFNGNRWLIVHFSRIESVMMNALDVKGFQRHMTAVVEIKRSAVDWQTLVIGARRRGEYLEVIDLARQGLEDYPGDLLLTYNKILAYARAGATAEAEANLHAIRVTGTLDAIADPALRTDFGALEARLLKDRAYIARGADGAALTHRAAEAYEAVYQSTGTYFPAINAATLYWIAGDTVRGRAMAAIAIALAQAEPPSFWQGATIAEAQILLGDFPSAGASLRAAVACGVHMDELATTRRQLAWLCEHLAAGADILAALAAPYILYWKAEASDGDPVWSAAPIGALVEARSRDGLPVLAYGAIVSLADIVVAETLTAAGAHTNLVIASTATACVETFGRRAGPAWGARLEAVLANARSVTEVTLEGDSTEHTVSVMEAQQARGLAAMRAAALVTGLHTIRIGLDGLIFVAMPSGEEEPVAGGEYDRISRAFVFGDVKGFSTISEAAHRPFLDYVIGGFADVLAELGSQVEYTETAGDGIYVVVTSVIAALRCCRGFQQVMEAAPLVAAGLPPTLGLRLGAHVGPVARGLDRVTGRDKFIGKEVIRTARIEAVTPVGQTYVTEQFAATLHALSPVGHACEYVGWQAMAKGFGRCRMYSLRPTSRILSLLRI
jgi:adenylate cyclase